ncbi:hypothetical protein LEN26_010730 [Aphanomyces euteiches]|nr:hypothetical protein LEN26_010730 [Aphanomyces euteiches]KAH9127442.1 hypothetical protein AeMF1_002255 [Aphanomyces euteiches]KAH9193123.1 hypothetical protein AeNC1_004900 [Aphanomyces euteiches]
MDTKESLERENAYLRQELDLFRGVLSVMQEDLNVKNEQIEHIFSRLRASLENQEQQASKRELQTRVDHLECVLRATDEKYARVQKDLLRAKCQLYRQSQAPFTWCADDVTVKIFAFLDVISLHAVLLVNHSWHDMVMTDMFWETMYFRRWSQRVCLSQTNETAIQPNNQDHRWVETYKERHILEHNWSSGKAVITTLSGHNGTVMCLQFEDDSLVSGSDDGSLMLWSLAPRSDDSSQPINLLAQQHHRQTRAVQKLYSFYGHGGPVWALRIHGNTLISGSYDKTVKLWSLQSGQCVGTLRAHTGWVSSLDACGSRIASGSWDSTVHIWNADNGDLVTTLNDEPANPIYCLKWEQTCNVIATGCRRRGIQVWDAIQGRCIQTFLGHSRGNQVNGLQAKGNLLVSGGSDSTVKVWDRRDSTCASTLEGHTGAVMSVDLHDNWIVSGSYDRTIKLWDIRRPKSCVQSVEGHASAVFALQIDLVKIISGSADTTIKIFSFHQ